MAIERIEVTTAFDSDVKSLKKKHVRLAPLWDAVAAIVGNDRDLLSTKYHDHALSGNWVGFRELHISGDWLLVYRVDGGAVTLVLTRTGGHDELFGAKTTRGLIRSYLSGPTKPMASAS